MSQPNSSQYAVRFEDLHKIYRMGTTEVRALDGVTANFTKGSFWAIMGPSGSGKSTMLNLLGCLDRPTSGKYFLDDQDVSTLDDDDLSDIRLKYLGFIFQSFNLIPQLTVEENIALPLMLDGKSTRDTRDTFRFPSRGSMVSIQTELVTAALGSYESYARFNLSGTKYIPVVRDFILKLGADYSTLSNDDAAIFDRYFGGGIGTVRGFKRRDISPIDRHEDPLGGRSMLTGTMEILKPVKDFMYVSAFVDAGNAWWDTTEFDLGDLNVSVGVGVQFKALPISLYYGIPVSTSYDHLDGKSGRFHFNIGYTY